jgi:hypothetical protein
MYDLGFSYPHQTLSVASLAVRAEGNSPKRK